MNIRFLTVLLLGFQVLAAQPGEVTFLGRIVDAGQKGVRSVQVSLVGMTEARTDDNGLFQVSVPASVSEVQVELDGYEVVYPRGGRAPVPRSATTPVVFEVKKLQNNEQTRLVQQLRSNIQKLEKDKRFKESEIARLEKNMQDSILVYQRLLDQSGGQNSRLLDSLERKVQQLLAAQEAALLGEKKAALYGQITQTMLNFLDKAKNLRDALARIDDVFLSNAARTDFERQVTAYNTARDSLYSLDRGFAENVRLFWNDADANAKMTAIHETAIIQIHEGIILPLNKSVVDPVRDAATGQASRVSASKKARKGAHKALEQLAFPLRNLELKINELMGILSR